MKIFYFIFIIIFFSGCGTLKDAGKVLRNEKVSTTDEFLIKKRKPLVLPPDYNEIPEPGSTAIDEKDDNQNIKKILKAPEIEDNQKQSSSIEESILKNIRK